MAHDYPVDKLFDKLFKLLLTVIGLVPWFVGMRLDAKYRKEKKERERRHNTNFHNKGTTKTKAANASGEHSEDKHRNTSRSNGGIHD